SLHDALPIYSQANRTPVTTSIKMSWTSIFSAPCGWPRPSCPICASPARAASFLPVPASVSQASSTYPLMPHPREPSRPWPNAWKSRSEEHTSELQSRFDLVCRLLLEKKNKIEKKE